MRLNLIPALAFALSLAVSGCGDDHDHDPDGEEHSAEEEACEHLEDGPSVAITAADSVTNNPPNALVEHTRADIDFSGAAVGVVALEATEEGEFLLFMNSVETPTAATAAGDAVALTPITTTCASALSAFELDLEVGTTFLTFDPAPASIQLIVEHAGEHDEEHDDHSDGE